LRSIVRAWGDGKMQNRRGWCQALHAVVCAGKGNGSLLFHAFPQEVIDKVAEQTGSTPVEVSVPNLVDGEVEFDEDGRVFLVEQFSNGDGSTHERKIFLLRISRKGECLWMTRLSTVCSHSQCSADPERFRDGKVVFNNIRQRPIVRRSTTTQGQPCAAATSGENLSPSDAGRELRTTRGSTIVTNSRPGGLFPSWTQFTNEDRRGSREEVLDFLFCN